MLTLVPRFEPGTAIATFNVPDRERKPGSIGVPIGGAEIKVVDDDDRELPRGEAGELVVRGPSVMKGYWNRDDATEEAMRGGWLHTWDVARFDEEQDDGRRFVTQISIVATTPNTGDTR